MTNKRRNRKDPIPWKCPNGHIMGVISKNGSNVSQLILYRQAIDMESDEPIEPEVFGVLDGIGGMDNIKCSLCGEIRDWDPDREALKRLLKQVERNRRSTTDSRRSSSKVEMPSGR